MSIKMIFCIVLLVTFVVTGFGSPTTLEPTVTTTASVDTAESESSVTSTLSANQKIVITNYLNMYRYSSNIEWDDTLASSAQTGAEACPTDTLSELADSDEILIYLPNSFDVEIDTVHMFKSAEHSSSFVRLYTCNPTIIRYGTADKVGCGYFIGCDGGNAFVCMFSPKGPSYCAL